MQQLAISRFFFYSNNNLFLTRIMSGSEEANGQAKVNPVGIRVIFGQAIRYSVSAWRRSINR